MSRRDVVATRQDIVVATRQDIVKSRHHDVVSRVASAPSLSRSAEVTHRRERSRRRRTNLAAERTTATPWRVRRLRRGANRDEQRLRVRHVRPRRSRSHARAFDEDKDDASMERPCAPMWRRTSASLGFELVQDSNLQIQARVAARTRRCARSRLRRSTVDVTHARFRVTHRDTDDARHRGDAKK